MRTLIRSILRHANEHIRSRRALKPCSHPFSSIKRIPFTSKKRKQMTNHHLLIAEMTLSRYYLRQQKPWATRQFTKPVPSNITGPMFNGCIPPKLTKVKLSTLPGYILEFTFLQVASLRMSLKPFLTTSVEVSPVPLKTERYYSSTNRWLKQSKSFAKVQERI